MNNNYRIIRTICENVFQRILECRDNDTGAIFYSNIITSKKVINLINVQDLKKLKSNILECYSTEDRVYIFTKSLESDCRKLTDLAKNLTMKQQFDLAEKAINLASDIFNMTDVVQQKIMDLDKLYIDGNNDLIVDCNLIFEQEYDIADNETFKRLGNIIHVIFSGTEIIDYNISDNSARTESILLSLCIFCRASCSFMSNSVNMAPPNRFYIIMYVILSAYVILSVFVILSAAKDLMRLFYSFQHQILVAISPVLKLKTIFPGPVYFKSKLLVKLYCLVIWTCNLQFNQFKALILCNLQYLGY
jgi:hypothetical protein